MSRDNEVVEVTYTNWKGKTDVRRLILGQVRFGTSEWHPEPTYLISAFDLDHAAQIWKEYDLCQMDFTTTGEREAALREAAAKITDHGSRNDVYSKSRHDASAVILALIDTPTPPAAPEPTAQEAARVLLTLSRADEPVEITHIVLEIMDDGETGPIQAWLRALAEQD